MKKTITKAGIFLSIVFILCAIYSIGNLHQAHAQIGGYTPADLCWGSSCTHSADHPDQNICPRTGASYSGKTDAAGFYVTVNGTNIPVGQQLKVVIAPQSTYNADNPQAIPDSCEGPYPNDVSCLKRSSQWNTTMDARYSSGWPAGQASWNFPLFNQIGCSTGQCPNDFMVSVRFMGTIPNGLNCPNNDQLVHIQNGLISPVNITITCHTPPLSCPVLAKPVPTITCTGCT